MNLEIIRDYCIKKRGVTEGFPFKESILVFKLMGKIFLITDLNSEELRINLKCNPTYAIELRETYFGVIPGYHMNKKHWNTIQLHSDIPPNIIFKLIDHSYDLIFKKLTKKQKEELNSL